MWKKVLLVILVILAIIGAFTIYGSYKVVDNAIQAKEPQLRQYVQMDEAAQNKYLIDNYLEIMDGVDINKDGTPEEKAELELLKQVNTAPDVKQALIEMCRSLMATAVLMSDNVTNELSASDKAKYQQERSQLETRLDKYGKLLEAAGMKIDKD
ncbi:MAG: hypothetical protein IKI76_11510 [Selenomonadaceae bacterium]|nr:hypothetical protein [Selenomonadaceae bacterium]